MASTTAGARGWVTSPIPRRMRGMGGFWAEKARTRRPISGNR